MLVKMKHNDEVHRAYIKIDDTRRKRIFWLIKQDGNSCLALETTDTILWEDPGNPFGRRYHRAHETYTDAKWVDESYVEEVPEGNKSAISLLKR